MKRFFPFLFFAFIAFAHRVDLFVNYQNGTLDIFGYFSDGTPAKKGDVKIYGTNGELLYETKTDQNGEAKVKLSNPPPKVKVVLYAGLGHKAQREITLRENTPSQPQRENNKKEQPSQGNTQNKTFQPKEHLPWRGVFCGLGCILALFGILNFVNGFRRGKDKT